MIEVELGHINIHLGLDAEGEQIYNVQLGGDITYIQALGLCEAAKRDIPGLFAQETWGVDG